MASISRFLAAFVLVAAVLTLTAPSAAAQPAPPLTEMYVTEVASNQAYDRVPAGSLSTPSNHGGTILQVAVFERGYARNQIAQFNGVRMSLTRSVPLTDSARRVYGYIRVYEYRGSFTSGTFTCSASSLVFPFRTLSTRLYVR